MEMAKTDQQLKLTNNIIALSKEDMSNPMVARALRGTLSAAGFNDKDFQDSVIKAQTDQRQQFFGMAFKALKGGMTQEDIMAGASGMDQDKLLKLIELSEKFEDKRNIREGRKEVLGLLNPPGEEPEALLPQVVPEQTPPSTTLNQKLTGVAQRAAQYGLNPATAMAILGVEGTPDGRPSPVGAAGKFQVMPETARPHLVKINPAFAQMPAKQITNLLASSPQIAEEVAFAEMKKLQDQFGDNPKAIAGAWISGPGNVNPDGSLKRPDVSDGNLTAQQYQDRVIKRVDKVLGGQSLTAEAPLTANDQESAALSRLDKKIVGQNKFIEGLTKAQTGLISRGDQHGAEMVKSRLTTEMAKLVAAEKEKSDIQGRIATRENQNVQQKGATERVILGHEMTEEAQKKQQARAFAEERATKHVPFEEQNARELGAQQINDRAARTAIEKGEAPPEPLVVPEFENKEQELKWAKENNVPRRKELNKAGEKVPDALRSNVRILDNYAQLFELAPLANTGPVSGRIAEFKDKWGLQGDTNQAVFDAMINKIFNQDLREFAGAGMTLAEIQNKKKELLAVTDQPKVFAAKAQLTYDLFYRDHGKYVNGLEKSNYYVPSEMQPPIKKAKATIPGTTVSGSTTVLPKPGKDVQGALDILKPAPEVDVVQKGLDILK